MPSREQMEKGVIRRAKKLQNFNNGCAAVVGAYWGYLSGVATNHSGCTYQQLDQLFDDRLKVALRRLGRLASKVVIPNNVHHETANFIGNCAEQHACNKVLRQDQRRQVALTAIRFTKAYRPRTLQIIPYCYVCRHTFNLHN